MKGNLTKVSEALQPYREQRAEAYKEKAAALREYARGFAWGRTSRGHRPGQWHEQRADGLRRPVWSDAGVAASKACRLPIASPKKRVKYQ